ncbi:MAG: FAD-binding oxidoreductase [Reyranellaceae bacterium]
MFTPRWDSQDLPRTPYRVRGGVPLDLPALAADLEADIAIVGGGIAGCSAALHAAEAGARVVLIEGQTIGWGASGRNAGHLPAATKHEPEEIVELYGKAFGERIIEASETGPRTVAALAERHGIDCELAFPGIITAAHTEEALKGLEHRADYWQKRGRPLEALDRDRLAAMLGSRFYLGGVIDRRGGSINPLAYVRGLARAALKAGAQLFERTRATALRRDGKDWVLDIAGGRIRARTVFLCTNAYTDDLWPGLRRTVIPVRTVQFTTRPLSDNLLKTILPGRQPMVDTRRVLISVRIHQDGRLHFGSGPSMRAGSAPTWQQALARLNEIYPQIGDIEIDDWWPGWMAFNKADSWQMHTLASGLFATLGCNGRGVALATIYGRDLARHAGGVPADQLTLPMTPLDPVGLHAFSGIGAAAIAKWWRVQDAREMRRLKAVNRA